MMNSCCTSSSLPGTNKFFSKSSKRYLKQFRKRGLAKEQRLLLEGFPRYRMRHRRSALLSVGTGLFACDRHRRLGRDVRGGEVAFKRTWIRWPNELCSRRFHGDERRHSGC